MSKFKPGNRIRFQTRYEEFYGTVLVVHNDQLGIETEEDPDGVECLFVPAENCVVITDHVKVKIERNDAEMFVEWARDSDQPLVWRVGHSIAKALDLDYD